MVSQTPTGVREIAASMTEAANALIGALDERQRGRLTFAFEDERERRDWAYFPRERGGLAFGSMDPKQRLLARRLIATGLSGHAYAKATQIIALEHVLGEIEVEHQIFRRDPALYALSIFGEPAGGAPWGWRAEGHHLNLHYTIAGGDIAALPIFMGANPAEVQHGNRMVSRPLAEEQDVAFELLASLDREQRARAVICDVAPPDILTTNLPMVPEEARPRDAFTRRPIDGELAQKLVPATFWRARPAGLPASAMTGQQRALLDELMRVYVERLPRALAAHEMQKLERAGIDAVHFAWAGEDRPRRGHYYRLQGPSVLVEYDNTQDGANHIHAVWRDPGADFGANILREHRRTAHR